MSTSPGPAALRLQHDPSRRRAQVLAALLAVAVLVSAVLAWRLVSGGDGRDDAERSALAVARDRAVQITSYSADTYAQDVAWAESGATASFAAEYAKANAPLRKVVEKVDASATGHVVAAAATARDADHVTVLLFVDQTVTRGSTGKQTTQDSRVEMQMVRRDGRWLVDDVTLR